MSPFDQVEQIRRAHASARPKDENPAWKNCHRDCGVLLRAIEELRQDAARYRWSTATEDNASTLHSILLCHAGDQAKIDERVDEYLKGEKS